MFGLKKKLMAATSMLVVSAMMLTTASFAWFTISTNPEISGLTATVTVNENLEIALAGKSWTTGDYTAPSSGTVGDTGDYQTYGNLVDMTAYFAESVAEAGDAFDTTLFPATFYNAVVKESDTFTSVANTFYYPQYDDYGRVGVLNALETEAISAKGYGYLYADADTDKEVDENEVTYGYYIDYWVKTNMTDGGNLLLSEATDRYTDTDTDTTTGSGSYISYTSTATSLEAATVDKDIEELLSYLTIVFVYDDTTATDADTYVYAHIATTTDDGTSAITVDAPTVTGSTGAYTVKYLLEVDDTDTDKAITTLTANTDTLIRMYVYLEGSDMTNADALLGDDVALSLNVQFALDTDKDGDVDASDALDTSMILDMTYGSTT